MANINSRGVSSRLSRFVMFFCACALVAFSLLVLTVVQPPVAQAELEGCTDVVVSDGASREQPDARGVIARSEAEESPLFWNGLTKSWLTDEQISLLKLAYTIALADGGREHAELVQAVMLQETIAGHLGRIGHMTAPVGKRSYGIMQVKVTAARDVLRKFPGEFDRFRADEELIARLLMDDEFNIRMGSKFLMHLRPHTQSTEQLLVAYNIGLRASRKVEDAEKFKYTLRTQRNLHRVVKPFNQRFIDGPVQVAINTL